MRFRLPGSGLLYPYPGAVDSACTVYGPVPPGGNTTLCCSTYCLPVCTSTPPPTPQSVVCSSTRMVPAASTRGHWMYVLVTGRVNVSATEAALAPAADGLVCALL